MLIVKHVRVFIEFHLCEPMHTEWSYEKLTLIMTMLCCYVAQTSVTVRILVTITEHALEFPGGVYVMWDINSLDSTAGIARVGIFVICTKCSKCHYYRSPEGGRLYDMKVVSGYAFLRTYFV